MTSWIYSASGASSVGMSSISDREIGKLEQEFSNIKHRLRNQKMEIEFLVAEVREVRSRLENLRSRTHTVAVLVLVFGSVFAWLVDLFRS